MGRPHHPMLKFGEIKFPLRKNLASLNKKEKKEKNKNKKPNFPPERNTISPRQTKYLVFKILFDM